MDARLHAAETALHALGVTVVVGDCPTATHCTNTPCANGGDAAVWDPAANTLRLTPALPPEARLLVLTDMWSAIIAGPQAARHARPRRHLTLIPTALAAIPLTVAACLAPAVTPTVTPVVPAAATVPAPTQATRHTVGHAPAVHTPRRRRPATRTGD